MNENITYVGLDVHKERIAMARARQGEEACFVKEFESSPARVLKELKALGKPSELRVCYEAGPTGYGLFRTLEKKGYKCAVVAPSMVPTLVGSRVKTDRRDAVKLARFHRSGDLVVVEVPTVDTEALRDLSRARDDAKKAQRVARQNTNAFMLRHGLKFEGKTKWTQAHMMWLKRQHLGHPAQELALEDYIDAVERSTQRLASLEQGLFEMAETWEHAEVVRALQALRGVSRLSAIVLACELGSMKRFKSPKQLMAYVGLVPSEHSSGDRRRRGGITKTGNGHARRILVESAWAYRFRPRTSKEMNARRRGLSKQVIEIGDRAQKRLCGRYQRMMSRGKPAQVTITAVARELLGFVWAIANTPSLVEAS